MSPRRSSSWARLAAASVAVMALLVGGAAASSADPTDTATTTTDPTTSPSTDPTSTSATSTTDSATSSPTSSSPSSSPSSTSTSAPVTTSSPTPSSTSTSPRSTSSPTSPAARPRYADERALSPTQLRDQIAQAEALRQEILSTNTTLAAAVLALEETSQQSNALLQAYSAATLAKQRAAQEAAVAKTLAEQLELQLEADHRRLGSWAYEAYAGGGALADSVTLFDAMVTDATHAGDAAGALAYLTDERIRAFERTRVTAEDKKVIADQAAAKLRAASAAATSADTAKRKLDAVIEKQQKALVAVREVYLDQVEQAGPIAGLLMGQSSTEARAALEALIKAMRSASDHLITGTGKTCSGDESPYPNGAIPPSALCPLWGAAGQYLRPTAAAAFSSMSKAYARDTSRPLCVTDSYRTFTEQVALKAEKGKWAATPGTSEHGYGKAVDLCGGVESFGTAAHLWMKANAPLYGWFHPDWAEPTGSLPEPWHWEFAG